MDVLHGYLKEDLSIVSSAGSIKGRSVGLERGGEISLLQEARSSRSLN